MQFHLSFSLNKPLTLPLSYHSTLQGFLYSILNSHPNYANFIHDTGYTNGSHSFKGFCYSLLFGEYRIIGSSITFYHNISFEVRSPLEDFCSIFPVALSSTEHFHLANQEIFLQDCTISKYEIKDENLAIRMISPMCVSQTYQAEEKKRTKYFSPDTKDFLVQINQNLSAKKQALLNAPVVRKINITPVHSSLSDKYVTKFRGKTYITAWNGTYHLSGHITDLQFLYDCGLGSRNSQGFGMFEII